MGRRPWRGEEPLLCLGDQRCKHQDEPENGKGDAHRAPRRNATCLITGNRSDCCSALGVVSVSVRIIMAIQSPLVAVTARGSRAPLDVCYDSLHITF
jgi:hypothetical protein